MRSALQEGLKRAATKRNLGPAEDTKKSKGARAGRVLIGGHFDPSVRQRLLAIRAKNPERTTQDLLEEAIDLLFERHKQPRMK